jgi:hypothetical protein
MKVYIVLAYFIHEDAEIDKVFDNKESANQWAVSQEKHYRSLGSSQKSKYYFVQEFEVQK